MATCCDRTGLIVWSAAAEPVSVIACDDPLQLARACWNTSATATSHCRSRPACFAISTTMYWRHAAWPRPAADLRTGPVRGPKPGPMAAVPTLMHIIMPMATTSRFDTGTTICRQLNHRLVRSAACG